MEKKQSNIDFLICQITEDQSIKAKSLNEWLEIFEQAKAMHKEEIIEAYDDGWLYNNQGKYNPEQYYNETFGGEKQC
jgi:hypothetical protein